MNDATQNPAAFQTLVSVSDALTGANIQHTGKINPFRIELRSGGVLKVLASYVEVPKGTPANVARIARKAAAR